MTLQSLFEVLHEKLQPGEFLLRMYTDCQADAMNNNLQDVAGVCVNKTRGQDQYVSNVDIKEVQPSVKPKSVVLCLDHHS